MATVIAILGAGGHGEDIGLTLPEPHTFYDDNRKDLPGIDAFLGGEFVIGVNDCRQRRMIAERLIATGEARLPDVPQIAYEAQWANSNSIR